MRRTFIISPGMLLIFSLSAHAQTLTQISGILDALQNVAVKRMDACNSRIKVSIKLQSSTRPAEIREDPAKTKAECINEGEEQVRGLLLQVRPMLNDKPRVTAALRGWFAKFEAALSKMEGKDNLDFHELDEAMKVAKNELAF